MAGDLARGVEGLEMADRTRIRENEEIVTLAPDSRVASATLNPIPVGNQDLCVTKSNRQSFLIPDVPPIMIACFPTSLLYFC